MEVHATIVLRKDIADLDKADDWFAEIHELLQGKTKCTMSSHSSNREPTIEIKKEPPDG